MTYPRPCRDCDEIFQPSGKYVRYCKKCKNLRLKKCPYKSYNNQCCNKHIEGKWCGYKQPKNCEMYIEWVATLKDDSGYVKTRERAIPMEVSNE